MAYPIIEHHEEGTQDVQELVERYANSSLIEIPGHFILPEKHRPFVAVNVNSRGEEIPVIDMAGLDDPIRHGDTMDAIHKACMEWGFFQVINHGVPHELMKRTKECVEEFLSLPISGRAPFGVLKGVVGEGYTSAYIRPNIGVADWRDFLLLQTYPDSERNYQIWPNNPIFKQVVSEYCKEIKVLSTRMLACLSENLGLASLTSLEEALGEFYQYFAINHYPPCPQPGMAMGVNEHSDLGVITYLCQTEGINGLQVLKDGEWVIVNPLPGAYLINVADQVEIISNGIYKSVKHRAILSSTMRRISIVCFQVLHPETIVKPMPELITPNHLSLYPPTRFLDHSRKSGVHVD